MSGKADKLRKLAGGLQKEIDDKRRPRPTHTRKKLQEAESQLSQAAQLEMQQRVLRRLAEEHERDGAHWSVEHIDSLATLRTVMGCQTVPDEERPWMQEHRKRLLKAGLGEDHALGEARTLLDQYGSAVETEEQVRVRRLAGLERGLSLSLIPGFFPTPPALLEQMLEQADLITAPGLDILEPSAGKGDIVEAIVRGTPQDEVVCCEQAGQLCDLLELKGLYVIRGDFLEWATQARPDMGHRYFDRVVMNPPFEQRQDVAHVQAAYGLLRPGGILVALMSPGPFQGQQQRDVAFRAWFEERDGEFTLIGDGFKEAFRRTGVSVMLVVLHKQEEVWL